MKYRFFIYGFIGWCMEILWTGMHSLITRDVTLTGYTSLWMFLIYGLAIFLEPVQRIIANRNIFLRGFVYMLCILLIEYLTGWLLRTFTGYAPWNYSGTPYNIHGLVRLDYAPAWFCAGLFFEFVHRRIKNFELTFERTK